MTTVRETLYSLFSIPKAYCIYWKSAFFLSLALLCAQVMNAFAEIGTAASCHNQLSVLRTSNRTNSRNVAVPIISMLCASDRACVCSTNPTKWVNLISLKKIIKEENDKLFLIVCLPSLDIFFLIIFHFLLLVLIDIAGNSKKLWKRYRWGGRRVWLRQLERVSK